MTPMKLRFLLGCALLVAGTPPIFAAALQDAKIRQILNDVRIEGQPRAHAATPEEVLPGSAAILTGVRSRAELTFADQTLARLGAETTLRLQPGTRDLVLDRGTLLVQIPPLRSARVRLGSLTASAGSATLLVEHLPGSSVKIVVLEGDLRVSVAGFLGDSIVLAPGKMLITKPDVRRLPDAVDVDLRTLTQTSSLIADGRFQTDPASSAACLPSMPLILRVIERQARLVKARRLFPTNLVIVGSGTTVVIPGAAPAAAEQPPNRHRPNPASPTTPPGAKIVSTKVESGAQEE